MWGNIKRLKVFLLWNEKGRVKYPFLYQRYSKSFIYKVCIISSKFRAISYILSCRLALGFLFD